MIPGLSCTFASLLPGIEEDCTGNYTVKQSDIDNFATSGTLLSNTATATGNPPVLENQLTRPAETDTSTVDLPSATPALTMDFDKAATPANFDSVGDVIEYVFTIKNTGTVTFPNAPVITDGLTGGATCPTGPVAPDATITCLANYTIQQSDIYNSKVDNSATATISVDC